MTINVIFNSLLFKPYNYELDDALIVLNLSDINHRKYFLIFFTIHRKINKYNTDFSTH